jgi:hypothetical protein
MKTIASRPIHTPEDLISAVRELTAQLAPASVYITCGMVCVTRVVLREAVLSGTTLYNLSLEPCHTSAERGDVEE